MPPRGRPSRAALHARLAEEVSHLRSRLGGLPSPAEAQDIWRPLWHQEAHHSTALEGNTLLLREVEVLLNTGRAVGNKELKDYVEVQGYAAAAEWVYSRALDPQGWYGDSLLTLTEVREVHHLAMGPVWDVAPHPQAAADEAPGNWRCHNIRPFTGMRPPDFLDVPSLITGWVESVNRIQDDPAPVAEAVAHCHAAFARHRPG